MIELGKPDSRAGLASYQWGEAEMVSTFSVMGLGSVTAVGTAEPQPWTGCVALPGSQPLDSIRKPLSVT